jgi:hypothetical protein
MMSHVGENDLEFLVIVEAREAHSLHALVDRHLLLPIFQIGLRCDSVRSGSRSLLLRGVSKVIQSMNFYVDQPRGRGIIVRGRLFIAALDH